MKVAVYTDPKVPVYRDPIAHQTLYPDDYITVLVDEVQYAFIEVVRDHLKFLELVIE